MTRWSAVILLLWCGFASATQNVNIPSSGSASWKDPVASVATLPAAGNSTGDARVTEDTFSVYVWTGAAWQSASGSGTVTSVSVVSANGFSGSVATSTTTPAITLSTTVTGILNGNGTSVAAAVG